MFLFGKDRSTIYKIEKERKKHLESFSAVPEFDLGLDYLKIKPQNSPKKIEKELINYVDHWFRNPSRFFEFHKDHAIEEINGFFEFPSILNKEQIARFKYNEHKNSAQNKVAVIHLMHWGGQFNSYQMFSQIIKKTSLPVSTLIFIPAGRGLNPGVDCPADFESVNPNIGKTIFKTIQNIHDIQFMAKYLKEEKGYDQVGLFTYSIGSLYGTLASMLKPGLFDFAVFQMVADDFSDALMEGISTKHIARKIKGNIDRKLLRKLWSMISPGYYVKYFSNLPKNTRIVQCEYDFVFGEKNVQKFTDKIKKYRPDIEIEIDPIGHITYGDLPGSLVVMERNIEFIFKNTKISADKAPLIAENNFFNFFKKFKATKNKTGGNK